MTKKIEDNLREFVYGGMDGAVTTFAIVTGAAGASLGSKVILILGFANVLADGFSMAVGAYLSEKSDNQLSVSKGESSAEDHEEPLGAAIATFISFILVGFVPLMIYTIDYIFDLQMADGDLLIWSILLTLSAFAGIGYLRGFIAKISKSQTIIESLGLGLAAAVISYGVGNLIEGLLN